MIEINEDLARKVLETVDKGLTSGLGKQQPGNMCVEAAVCYAMGMPHGDKPSCVGDAVRAYKIQLNDARWSSKEERAQGMRRVAIAQLGSQEIDQLEFAKEVTLQVTKDFLPITLRAAGALNQAHKEALETAAVACEIITTFAQVKAAANAAAYAAYAATAATNAATAATAAVANAAYAAERNSILSKAAEIGVQALTKLGSQGCQWLFLTEPA